MSARTPLLKPLAGALLAVAAIVSLTLSVSRDGSADTAPPQGPPEVGVVTLQASDVPLSTELPGRTTAYLIAEVRPQVGGILLRRLFEEGSDVKAGQPLYQIDPAPYRATLARAEASLESARLLAERYARLIKQQAISQQDNDDAQSQYLQARASAESARIDLGYTRISAPISGRIGRSSVTQGALLTANQATALATVQQLDPIYVDIVQPSTALLRLKEDLASGRLQRSADGRAEVHLILENGKPYALAGKLQFSEISVDEGTGAVTLRAVFPNPQGLLLPGMFVRAQLQEGVRSQVLLVPQRGVTRDPRGQATALVVGADDKVELREVTVERSVGPHWLISAGLAAGERLIVDGVQNVRPGMPVHSVPAADTPAPAAQ
ncbi:efflux RND transporter periplasmic adaptor subunit [Plasticicumulans acidivorans]|uniref:Membrane fusion protein (Multidrug efflux system) n=1 Tax=Plasticicumulans acidivorans TaxID=886464 RepID=A0A317MZG9_9GAMM|nr:efflux RND transporter periplasmic adaptor subunit [Plasticicumulans acidivorans]PWV65692.1 membrane fusion protein (multidrug efflux system) [Plasticicumulans acidivorans]